MISQKEEGLRSRKIKKKKLDLQGGLLRMVGDTQKVFLSYSHYREFGYGFTLLFRSLPRENLQLSF